MLVFASLCNPPPYVYHSTKVRIPDGYKIHQTCYSKFKKWSEQYSVRQEGKEKQIWTCKNKSKPADFSVLIILRILVAVKANPSKYVQLPLTPTWSIQNQPNIVPQTQKML